MCGSCQKPHSQEKHREQGTGDASGSLKKGEGTLEMLKPQENWLIPPSTHPGPQQSPPAWVPGTELSSPQQAPDQCLSFPSCKSLPGGRISGHCPGGIPSPRGLTGAGVKVEGEDSVKFSAEHWPAVPAGALEASSARPPQPAPTAPSAI